MQTFFDLKRLATLEHTNPSLHLAHHHLPFRGALLPAHRGALGEPRRLGADMT